MNVLTRSDFAEDIAYLETESVPTAGGVPVLKHKSIGKVLEQAD
jgi:hypothetical protein